MPDSASVNFLDIAVSFLQDAKRYRGRLLTFNGKLLGAITAAILALSFSAIGTSAPLPIKLDAKIFLEISGDDSSAKIRNKIWQKSCGQLASHLKTDLTAFGSGPFQTITCEKKPSKLSRMSQTSNATWLVQVLITDSKSRIKIYFNAAKKPVPEVTFTNVSDTPLIDQLADKRASREIALELKDQLPMSTALVIRPSDPTLKVSQNSLPSPLPAAYQFFTAEYDPTDGWWKSRALEVIKTEDIGTLDTKKRLDALTTPSTVVFAQDARGRGKNTASIQRDMVDSIKSLVGKLFNILTANMSGVRYFIPLKKSNDIIESAGYLGILTEIRSGSLKGLRAYYDTATGDSKRAKNGEELIFDRQSINLGWSFYSQIPPLLGASKSGFDLQPRIGMFSLNAAVAGTDQFGAESIATFKMKHSLNLGGEIGLEQQFPFVLMREWGSINRSAAVTSNVRYQSIKGGIDTYWRFIRFSALDLRLLTFVTAEQLRIEKKNPPASSSAQEPVTTDLELLSYLLPYYGIGITLNW